MTQEWAAEGDPKVRGRRGGTVWVSDVNGRDAHKGR